MERGEVGGGVGQVHPVPLRVVQERAAPEQGLQATELRGTGGQHQAGTCRMGADPKTSVTDPTGRLHGVENVYVADGSLLVTNGGFNPALTIFALGFRTGECAAKAFRRAG